MQHSLTYTGDGIYLRVVTDVAQCRLLWEQALGWLDLDQQKDWYQQWELRAACCTAYGAQPWFVTAQLSEGDGLMSLIPLQVNAVSEVEFFGGWLAENNVLRYAPGTEESAIAAMTKVLAGVCAPENADIDLDNIELTDHQREKLPQFETTEPHFIATLTADVDLNAFIAARFSGRSRKRRRRMADHGLMVEKTLCEGGLEMPNDVYKQLVTKLVALSKQRFGTESDFSDPPLVQAFLHFPQAPGKYVLLSFLRGEELLAVSLAVLHNGTYIFLNSGVAAADEEVGGGVIAENIKAAIELGADFFDAGFGDSGWKSRWGLQPHAIWRARSPKVIA